jgi:hypothetical protein
MLKWNVEKLMCIKDFENKYFKYITIFPQYKARVRNVEKLHKVREERNVLCTINRMKDNW